VAVLSYVTVATALEAFDGAEHSSEAQQYLNSIGGDTVVIPGSGAVVPASQALVHKRKHALDRTIRDGPDAFPARLNLTRESLRNDEMRVTLPAFAYDATLGVDLITTPADLYSALAAADGQELAALQASLGNVKARIWDLYANYIAVPARDYLYYYAKGFYWSEVIDGEYIDLSGTGEACSETEIITGGQTAILTLSGGFTWAAEGATFNALRQGFIDAISPGGVQANGFEVEVIPLMAVGDVVRTSDTVVTITFPAAAGYSIEGDPESCDIYVPPKAIITPPGGAVQILRLAGAVTVTPD